MSYKSENVLILIFLRNEVNSVCDEVLFAKQLLDVDFYFYF
jgi:hypothetical protein